MRTQDEKAEIFYALHQRDKAFIIPNPWNIGSARMLESLGFEALATTSAGYAFFVGKRDNTIGRDETIAHAVEIVAATDLPISADLENGFGDDPESVAETVRQAAQAGLAGCSIEDGTGRSESPLYEFELAVERIRAAVEAARALPFSFMLTARAENFVAGQPDLKDVIKRLQAYQEAGADVLYAPGLKSRNEIESVISSVDRPINILAGLPGFGLTVAELSEIGVKRISLGSALARAALGSLLRAAREMLELGTFSFTDDAVNYRDVSAVLETYSNPKSLG